MKKFTQIQPYLYATPMENYVANFTKKGDIGIGFKLGLKEVNTLSITEINEINDLFTKSILLLPPGAVIHKQDFFFFDSYKGSNLDRTSELNFNQEAYFFEREILDHESYLYLSLQSASFINRGSSNTIFMGGKGVKVSEEKVRDFIDAVGQFTALMSTSSITISPLTRAENLKVKYKYFSLSKNANIVADFSFKDELRSGDKIVDIISVNSVESLPDEISSAIIVSEMSGEKSKSYGSYLHPISLKLQCDHILNTVIQRVDEKTLLNKLKKENESKVKGVRWFSNKNMNIYNGNKTYIEESEDGLFTPCRFHFNLITINDEPEKRREIKNLTGVAISGLGIKATNNKTRYGNLFWGCAPFNAGDLPKEVMGDTFVQLAACFQNWESNATSGIDGLVFNDRLSQRPIVVDMWDQPYEKKIISNRNCFIAGASGEGKSVLMNHIFSQYLEQDYALVIMDIGDSYKKLCILNNGLYYKYDRKRPLFNPFIVKGKPDAEFIESLTDLLFTAWKQKGEEATREEESVLKNSLRSYYTYLTQNSEIEAKFDTYYTHFFENSEKVRDLGMEIFNAESFFLVMKDFCSEEIYGNIFNGQENVDINKHKMIVFELDNIKDNSVLFPIVSHVITHTINNTVFKKKGVRKSIWMDEAWRLFESTTMANFIKYLYKTLRKRNAQVGIAVQEITDIPDNAIGKTILNNSSIKFILPHKLDMIPLVQEKCSLSDHGVTLLHSTKSNLERKTRKYSEFLVQMGTTYKVLRLELSPYAYFTYTSDEDTNLDIYKWYEKTGDMHKAIQCTIEQYKAK